MLTQEENELLARAGPGTPCGEMLRRYWYPVAAAQELTDEHPTKFRAAARRGSRAVLGQIGPHRTPGRPLLAPRRLDALSGFLAYYNHHRPHGGIGGATPASRL